MSNEPLGLVKEAQRRRTVYARFLSPPDRVATKSHHIEIDLGTGRREVRKPVIEPPNDAQIISKILQPREETEDDLRLQIRALKLKLTTRERELQELRHQLNPRARIASLPAVMETYCRALAEAGYVINGKTFDAAMLMAHKRSQVYAWPRHVCIYLMHHLSGSSSSIIGRIFGIDHTSVLHACRRAPDHLARVPLLAQAHALTLAAFETAQ